MIKHTRRSPHARPLVESLEPRTLLSAALPGTVISNFLQTSASAHLVTVDLPHDLETQLTVSVNHFASSDIDAINGDSLHLSLQIFQHSSHTLLTNLTADTNLLIGLPPDAQNASVHATDRTLDISGIFTLHAAPVIVFPGPPAPGPFPTLATVSLNLHWSLTDLLTRQETLYLNLSPLARNLTTATSRHGPATFTGSAAFLTVSPELQTLVPGISTATPIAAIPPGTTGVLDSITSLVRSLPFNLSLDSIIQSLTPPNSSPNNALITASTQFQAIADFALSPAGSRAGYIQANGEIQPFAAPPTSIANATLIFAEPSFAIAGFGAAFNPLAHSVTVNGSDQFIFNPAVDGFPTPGHITANLKWTPTSVAQTTLTKVTSYNASTTNTTFTHTTTFNADITGGFTTDSDALNSQSFSNISISETSTVSITTSTAKKPPATFITTPIAQKDWLASIAKPFQALLKLIQPLANQQKQAPTPPAIPTSTARLPTESTSDPLQLLN